MQLPSNFIKAHLHAVLQLLGKYPGKSLHRIGVFIAGAWITSNTINFLWQKQINLNHQNLSNELSSNSGKIELTIFIIGLRNENRNKNDNTKIATTNSNQRVSYNLLKLENKKPLKIIKIKANEKIDITDTDYFVTLDESYKKGGPALASELLRKLLILPNYSPERYIILKEDTLKKINTLIGGAISEKEKHYGSKNKLIIQSSIYNNLSFQKGTLEKDFRGQLFSSEEAKEIFNKVDKIKNLKLRRKPNWLNSMKNEISNLLYLNSQTNLSEAEINNIINFASNSNSKIILEELNL